MGYKLTGKAQDYIDMLTPQMIKESFEEYGFEVEFKEGIEKPNSDTLKTKD